MLRQAAAMLHGFPTLVPMGMFRIGRPDGELGEHNYFGNNIMLQDPKHSDQSICSNDLKLELHNGLELTYGQINWLAGDFYGFSTPVSDGKEPGSVDELKVCKETFKKAFATLARRLEAKAEAEQIVADGQAEIDAVNTAKAQGRDPSTAVYSKGFIWDNFKWVWDTWDRPLGEGYLGLSSNNFDHFGEDTKTAYDAGHAVALEAAIGGDLNLAYAYNAFADHFLEDRFSSGHMRTPRRFLHGAVVGDLCAKYMHDEDSAIGLCVTNPNGKLWYALGDKRLLDNDDCDNEYQCHQAIQTSAGEVKEAYNTKKLPKVIGKAWDFAPTIESACDMNKQKLSPLFTPDGQLRNHIKDRSDKGHHKAPASVPLSAWFADIAFDCYWSGLWDEDKLHM